MKKLATYMPRGRTALAVDPKAFGGEFLVYSTPPEAFSREGQFAVVDICGPLTHHDNYFWDSYDAIRCRAEAAFASDAQSVLLKIDSPGGDVSGCFELARDLRKMAEASGKGLVAFSDGMACSAAYALASAANTIYGSETAFFGSIGVIEGMCDQTALDAAMGLRFTFITSGARKADGNPHVPVSEGAVAAMQGQVNDLAGLFYRLVEEHRGIPADAVQGLEAGVFFGEKAIAAKLIDRTVTFAALVAGETEGEIPVAKKLTEYLAALAEGEDKEEAKKAKKALAALLAEDSDGDEKEEPKKEEASASAEAEEKKASAELPEKKDSSAGMKAAAMAQTPDMIALARELHAIKAERAAEKDALLREKIFASRKDLDEKVVKALASVPTRDLAEVLETFPKAAFNAAATAVVAGTRGADQTDKEASTLPAQEVEAIDIAMGLVQPKATIRNVGKTLELSVLTPDQARAHLAAMNGGAK